MPLFSPRLPHALTSRDLVFALAPTYAAARGVDDEEAQSRLHLALASRGVLDELYGGVSHALEALKGPRTSAEALMDRLSKGVEARRHRVRPAEATPAIAAALIRLDVEIGVAPDTMRATLATDRGRAMLDEGLRALGAHLVKELLPRAAPKPRP